MLQKLNIPRLSAFTTLFYNALSLLVFTKYNAPSQLPTSQHSHCTIKRYKRGIVEPTECLSFPAQRTWDIPTWTSSCFIRHQLLLVDLEMRIHRIEWGRLNGTVWHHSQILILMVWLHTAVQNKDFTKVRLERTMLQQQLHAITTFFSVFHLQSKFCEKHLLHTHTHTGTEWSYHTVFSTYVCDVPFLGSYVGNTSHPVYISAISVSQSKLPLWVQYNLLTSHSNFSKFIILQRMKSF